MTDERQRCGEIGCIDGPGTPVDSERELPGTVLEPSVDGPRLVSFGGVACVSIR